jgi:hypothetical protein
MPSVNVQPLARRVTSDARTNTRRTRSLPNVLRNQSTSDLRKRDHKSRSLTSRGVDTKRSIPQRLEAKNNCSGDKQVIYSSESFFLTTRSSGYVNFRPVRRLRLSFAKRFIYIERSWEWLWTMEYGHED